MFKLVNSSLFENNIFKEKIKIFPSIFVGRDSLFCISLSSYSSTKCSGFSPLSLNLSISSSNFPKNSSSFSGFKNVNPDFFNSSNNGKKIFKDKFFSIVSKLSKIVIIKSCAI